MFISQLTLFSLLSVTLAKPVRKWYSSSLGANYFQTNGFDGNQLVANYIQPDGTLVAGTASWTYGNGSASINDPAPYANHPDPFLGDGSVIVSGDQVFVVNAGSDTFSVFDIDPADPGRPTFVSTYPSGYEYPVSLAASPDGQIVCVLNGGAINGFQCYSAGPSGWTHVSSWDRKLGLNLTTPPHGPVGGSVSQMAFASDMSYLFVAVKGRMPTDLNNPTGQFQPGFIAAYAITGENRMTLASEPVKTSAAVPFSIKEDFGAEGVYFSSDAATGYAAFRFGSEAKAVPGTIPNAAANCWVAQSHLTNSFYVVDTGGLVNITEVSIDPTSLEGTILSAQSLGNNSAGTDNSIFGYYGVDWMYVNAPAYQTVYTYKISVAGYFEQIQAFSLSDMASELVPTAGFAGQAVYQK
ncbi:MAG: hypothetical protein TREMPRED_002989 [Tremellales sp. Tagirdzhanova-0007]|nr:MAG: hypothetical protein TREMPRED_002989 [Tremellales sp. Tagirdzhanova-0007]